MEVTIVLAISLAVYLLLVTILRLFYPEPHEDWSKINLEEIKFPSGFSWGVATASHQIEGHNSTTGLNLKKNETKSRVVLHAITGTGGKTITSYC